MIENKTVFSNRTIPPPLIPPAINFIIGSPTQKMATNLDIQLAIDYISTPFSSRIHASSIKKEQTIEFLGKFCNFQRFQAACMMDEGNRTFSFWGIFNNIFRLLSHYN